jgi:hypothetical protein
MQWHYRLGHLTFPKLKQLALNGEIPKKLAKALPPECAGCLFGAMTKLPRQGKETKADHKVFVATKPGECISVDQMMLMEVRFYAQLKGKLTKKRYKCATIFVDHFSRLQFVQLQLNNGSDETLATKLAFKQYVAEHRVKTLHNHCENGRFHNNAFQQACHEARQQLIFWGLMPTSKTASPSKPSETSWNLHGSNCSTHMHAGRRQSTLLCGLMPYGMQPTFTTTYQC